MPPETQERTRTMESLQVSVRSSTTADTSDVYEAYVKPKDVKHKWIQTEDFEQGRKKMIKKNDFLILRKKFLK
jgi:hypothetical protein